MKTSKGVYALIIFFGILVAIAGINAVIGGSASPTTTSLPPPAQNPVTLAPNVPDAQQQTVPIPTQLSTDDQSQVKAIITMVLQTKGTPTQAQHDEFWAILDKYQLSDAYMQNMRALFTGAVVEYNRLFYQDALVAIKQGQSYKSPERKKYEDYLLSIGAITNDRVVKNDSTMQMIASQTPITTANGEVVFDEANITATLASIDETRNRISLLFTK